LNTLIKKRGTSFLKKKFLFTLHVLILIFKMADETKKIYFLNNPGDYERFFKENYSGLCRYARQFAGSMETAEEIVQDVFVRIWERRDQLDIHGSVLSYVVSAVRNSALNYIRHGNIVTAYEHNSQNFSPSYSSSAEDELISLELEIAISKAIGQLPEQRKKIFLMSRSEGLKYYEIADKLGLSIKTVEAQMGKALKQLRDFLKDYLVILYLIFSYFEKYL
jgi:RNA polymerase sigma-70 factor, ECF subfamily